MTRGLIRSVACALTVAGIAVVFCSPAPAATSTPSGPPAKASITLYLGETYSVARQPVTVPGRALHIGGVVNPYVPGQWVTVKALAGGRLIKWERLRIKLSRNRRYGRFTATIASPSVGGVVIYVRHSRTSKQRGFLATRSFAVLDENVGFGSVGPFVQLIQQRLAALHFYIPQTGVYDQGTGLAIDAYHRLLHWGTYQTLDRSTINWLLNGWGQFPVRYPSHGKHAEGNLSVQLLALTYGSHVYQIYPISSGKPSTPTILGNFRVYSKVPSYLPDGMYYSNFFIGGYAIHGYNPAPDYPASHGCMRVPIADATSIYYWLSYGDRVDVYY
jgi:hypothetical protein